MCVRGARRGRLSSRRAPARAPSPLTSARARPQLRQYRPADHRAYLVWLESAAGAFSVKDQIYSDPRSCLALLRVLNVVRMFRDIHWEMTKAYIIRQTKHPTATGGTPITSWLPNQLGATMEYMEDTIARVEHLGGATAFDEHEAEQYDLLHIQLLSKLDSLKAEVTGLQTADQFDAKEQLLDEFESRDEVSQTASTA